MLKFFAVRPFSHPGHRGLAAILVSLLISYALWLGSMAWYGDWYKDVWKYPAKVGSHGATLLMCWAFILSTRFKVVERIFGGLDNVYKAHRYVGEAAFFSDFSASGFFGDAPIGRRHCSLHWLLFLSGVGP